jgi:hypothetical protein
MPWRDLIPRQVIGRKPIAQARRQQQLLLAIARDEVLRHAAILLIAADGQLGLARAVRTRRLTVWAEPLRHHAVVFRVLAVVFAVAVSAAGVWAVLEAARFSMDGEGGSLRDLPAGFWFLLVMSIASFLLLAVGFLLRRR